MKLRLLRFQSLSLRVRMLLTIVGMLCLAQALYLFLGAAYLKATFDNKMIDRAISKYVLQAEALLADPDVILPAETASPLPESSSASTGPTSIFEGSTQARHTKIERRVRTALENAGIAVDDLQAGYGSHKRTPEQLALRRQSFGVWAVPTDTMIGASLQRRDDWLNVVIRSRPPPPPVTADTLLLNLAIVVGVGALGVALVMTQITRACRDLGRAASRVGFAGQGDISPVTGPVEFHEPIVAINTANRRVAELLVEKDVMLGAIGHDLRTPLTSLRLTIEKIEREEDRERAIAAVEETSNLLDDILELARSGKSDTPAKRYDLSALVDDIVADEADLGRYVTLDCDCRVVAVYRPASVRRLLQNLIDNALKYAGHARVKLSNGDGMAILVVEDSGPGVPEHALQTLLLPFRRGESSRNRTTGGSGLGLTISRAIARSHGGDLRLSNRHPQGLRVEVHLPM